MESRWQCPASSRSLPALQSLQGGLPVSHRHKPGPGLCEQDLPCQVKELQLPGGSELLLQPLLGCGAVSAPCPGSGRSWWGTGLPPGLLGLLGSSALHGLQLLPVLYLLSPGVFCCESASLGQPEGGREEVLAHGVSCRFHGYLGALLLAQNVLQPLAQPGQVRAHPQSQQCPTCTAPTAALQSQKCSRCVCLFT